MSVSGPPTDNPRKLFFHSLASVRESWVPTTVLRNRTLIENASLARSEFFISEDVREGQSIQEVMTDDGILIYSLLPKMAIACWNSAKPFKKENQHIIYQVLEGGICFSHFITIAPSRVLMARVQYMYLL